ncbi:LOW QUALITY PROTEIN: arylsulfatase I [Pholidichthys leucotaenia]
MSEGICSAFFLVIGTTLLPGLGCLDEHKSHDDSEDKEEVKRPRPPHLIFITVDDQGYGDIGDHDSDVHTPALDQLAAEGVKLGNYYVQLICSPSRSQLMTGRYQIHTGLQRSIIRPRQPLCLPPNIPALPERLTEAGYATHMVGKGHLGFCWSSFLPTGRGFQSFLGTLTGSGDHFSDQSCNGAEACGFDLYDGDRPAWEMRGNHSTLLYTERVKQILQSHDPHTPLFLNVSLQAAHTPSQVPDQFLHRYGSQSNRLRRHYAAMLSCLNDGVAQVVHELKTRGLYQNSVLIYSSDNGGQPLSGGSNWPLREGKGTYWEGGIRAVGFVHNPLLKRKGVVSRALIHVSDWHPTLLGLAGALQFHQGLDGHDVWMSISEGLSCPRTEILFNINPLSRKPQVPYEIALVHKGFGIWDTAIRAALRAGDWKLLTGNVGNGDWIPPRVFPSGPERWQKLEKRRDLGKSGWLFNISANPYERTDLTEAHPEVVKYLLTRIAQYNQTALMSRNPPDDPMSSPELHGGVWGPWLSLEEDADKANAKKEKMVKIKQCKLCKLKDLFRKVGSRLQWNTIF